MDTRTLSGALFYAGIGVAAMIRPTLVPWLFGATAPTAASRTEVRAVYGGLPLAIAALLVAEANKPQRPMTMAMAALSGGMAGGRLVGVGIEREANAVTSLLVAAEAGTALALGSSAKSGPGRPS